MREVTMDLNAGLAFLRQKRRVVKVPNFHLAFARVFVATSDKRPYRSIELVGVHQEINISHHPVRRWIQAAVEQPRGALEEHSLDPRILENCSYFKALLADPRVAIGVARVQQ